MHSRFDDRKIEMVASAVLPSHDEHFRVDYLDGMREFGFVYFSSAVILEDCNGLHTCPPGTGIFYLPSQPRIYGPVQGCMQHTWFLVKGPGVNLCLNEYKIPTFTALDLKELTFLEEFIHNARQEGIHLQDHYEDAITDLFCDFFRRVGAMLIENSEALSNTQRRKVKRLNEIRLSIHSDISRRWTVQDMAELEGLNPTRFAMEYRTQFGISPIDDLIDARLKRAEYMLTHLSFTVKRIASECGFNSIEHFTRLFHAKRGCSPGQFRKA